MSTTNVSTANVSSLVSVPAVSDVRTMLVESVKTIAARDQQQKRVAVYLTGSLALHLGMWAVLAAMPVEDSNVNLSLATSELTSTSTSGVTHEETPSNPDEQIVGDDDGAEGTGSVAMQLPSGQPGKPDEQNQGSLKIAKTHKDPAIARQQAIEYARSAGWLGNSRALDQAVSTLASNHNWNSSFDRATFYGPLKGGEGNGPGTFGGGPDGTGPGGGCPYGVECGTVPGSSKYNTIDRGPGAGDGPWGPGTGGPGTDMRRDSKVPTADRPILVEGGLDKSTIRRYIKMNTFKISYCYEHELLARGDLQGDIMVSFLITPAGTVQSSNGKGFDSTVASCVANVVKHIQFPAPKNGGNVQVNYPFSFRRTGR